MLKKSKRRIIKTKKPLVKHYSLTHRKLFSAFLTDTASEVVRNQIKYWQSSKINRCSLKTNLFKVITDIREQLKKMSRFIFTS